MEAAMQNDRYSNPGITIGACAWCRAEYVIGCSRALDQSVFCSKKCDRWTSRGETKAIVGRTRNPKIAPRVHFAVGRCHAERSEASRETVPHLAALNSG